MSTRLDGNTTVEGDLSCTGTFRPNATSGILRTELTQESLTEFVLFAETWRIWDNMDALLVDPPVGGSGNDDLGINNGTYATGVPSIQTGDNKAAGAVTKYARRTIQLPPNYVAGETVTIRLRAGMKTTIADVSATVDVQAFKSDNEGTVSGADLITTAATTCNSLTFGNKDFVVTPTALSPGDVLDVRIAIATNDAATATAVTGCIGKVSLLCDTKG